MRICAVKLNEICTRFLGSSVPQNAFAATGRAYIAPHTPHTR